MTKASGIAPINVNRNVPQGANYVERYWYLNNTTNEPMPYLDTATGLCQVRDVPADNSGSTVIATGTVTINSETGEIEVSYPIAQTINLEEQSGGCGYYRDITIIYDDETEDRIVTGRLRPVLEIGRVAE